MSEIPDLAPVFEEPSRREYGSWCSHAGYTVNEHQRTVTCSACKAALDPFQIILQQSNRQRVREGVDSEIVEQRKMLTRLRAEEKRIKARVRTAKKKDADEAVAKALAKAKEDHGRTIGSLIMARSEIADALKRLGYTERDWTLQDED